MVRQPLEQNNRIFSLKTFKKCLTSTYTRDIIKTLRGCPIPFSTVPTHKTPSGAEAVTFSGEEESRFIARSPSGKAQDLLQ